MNGMVDQMRQPARRRVEGANKIRRRVEGAKTHDASRNIARSFWGDIQLNGLLGGTP